MKIKLTKIKQLNPCQDDVVFFKNKYGNKEVEVSKVCHNFFDDDKISSIIWLITSLLEKDDLVRYAVYVAKLMRPIFKNIKSYSNVIEKAIRSTEKCLTDNSEKAINRNKKYSQMVYFLNTDRHFFIKNSRFPKSFLGCRIDHIDIFYARLAIHFLSNVIDSYYCAEKEDDGTYEIIDLFYEIVEGDPKQVTRVMKYGLELLEKNNG